MGVLLTKKQAAQYLGVSYCIISNLVHDGKLQRRKVGKSDSGKSWRITMDSLERYAKGADEEPKTVQAPRMRTFEEAFPQWAKKKPNGSKRANFS